MNRVAGVAGVALVVFLGLVVLMYFLAPDPTAGVTPSGLPVAPAASAIQGVADAPVAPVAAAPVDPVAPKPSEGAVDWAALDARIEGVRQQSWKAMKPAEWADTREDLLADLGAIRGLPEAERAAHREDELRLLAQIGRAAENANDPVAPFYAPVNGVELNIAFFEAAALVAAGDRAVIEVLGDNEREAVEGFVKQIDAGTVPKQPAKPLAR